MADDVFNFSNGWTAKKNTSNRSGMKRISDDRYTVYDENNNARFGIGLGNITNNNGYRIKTIVDEIALLKESTLKEKNLEQMTMQEISPIVAEFANAKDYGISESLIFKGIDPNDKIEHISGSIPFNNETKKFENGWTMERLVSLSIKRDTLKRTSETTTYVLKDSKGKTQGIAGINGGAVEAFYEAGYNGKIKDQKKINMLNGFLEANNYSVSEQSMMLKKGNNLYSIYNLPKDKEFEMENLNIFNEDKMPDLSNLTVKGKFTVRECEISNFDNFPKVINELSLINNKFSSLEGLPENVAKLNISGNNFKELEIPEGIKEASVDCGSLEALYTPKSLKSMNITLATVKNAIDNKKLFVNPESKTEFNSNWYSDPSNFSDLCNSEGKANWSKKFPKNKLTMIINKLSHKDKKTENLQTQENTITENTAQKSNIFQKRNKGIEM